MRRPPEGPYDVVLNLFSSIGYFADARPGGQDAGEAQDLAALRAWHQVLVPGGRLVVETNHRDRIAVIHTPGEELPVGDTGAVEFGRMDWATGVMHRTVRFADGTERAFRVRLYTATELVALVCDAGFTVVKVAGGWEGQELSPHTRLVVTATRPQG
jgi:SAM-dependent methyltransferase